MGMQLMAYPASSFIADPDPDDESEAAFEQFCRAERQPVRFAEGGHRLRTPLGLLLPESWVANDSAPFIGWLAPVWDARVERISKDVLRYPAELLRERLPAALREAGDIPEPRERLRVSAIVSRIVDEVASGETEGDPLYLMISA